MRRANRGAPPSLNPHRPIPAEGSLAVRVRYAECDPMGVAHHASYVPWLEASRTELLRAGGVTYADMEEHEVFLVVTKLALEYKAPAFYDDLLEVRVRVMSGGRARIDHEYEVLVTEPANPTVARQTLVATASTTLACVDVKGRPTPLPEWLTPGAHEPV